MEQKKKEFDLPEIKKLIVLIKAYDLTEIEVVNGDNKISLKRTSAQPVIKQDSIGKGSSDEDLEVIKALMPGTLYLAPSRDSDPYIEIGSKVTPKTTVCIIEAMKVINQIDAGTTGMIVEVLAKSGQAVEYGQPLFKVKRE